MQNSSLKVISSPGTLPSPSERSIVFLANLLSLFFGNAEETDLLKKQVGKIETYGGRLLPILDLLFPGKDNLLVLERAPTPELTGYFQQSLNLTLPRVVCFPHECYASLNGDTPPESSQFKALVTTLREHQAEFIEGFVSDRGVERLAVRAGKSTINTFDASRDGNDKVKLQRFLENAGLPVFDSFYATSRNEAIQRMENLRQMGYDHAVIKAAIGASGIGLQRIPLHRPEPIPDYLFHSGTCLVQGWMNTNGRQRRMLGSPSVQLYLDQQSLQLYDLTDQILDENSVHQGNISPPACATENPQVHQELLRQARLVGSWLHSLGYRGTASVDFLVVDHSGDWTAYVCEINARVTGATYPSLLARRFFPAGAWQMRNVLLSPPQQGAAILELLERHHLLFREGAKSGLIPVNFNHQQNGLVGKCQLLALASDTRGTHEIFQSLRSIEEFSWNYDRD